MKPTELTTLLTNRFNGNLKRPVHVEGPPGLGKTQIAAQVAKSLGVGFMVIHAPLLQPEDYGFPVITADRTNVNFIVSSAKFPIVGSNCPDRGIFLIDELSQADTSAQKILRNLIQEGEIHGQRLKPGWMIVTTGNRTTDRAGANRLLSHLSNVLTRVELEANVDDWSAWCLANGVKNEVISFIRFRPTLLNAFDPQNEINATPRAWVEGVAADLGVVGADLEFACFKGAVGEGPASEFLAFLQLCRNLPSLDAILLNPTKTPVPKDLATLYALCGGLAHKATKDNFARIMSYVNRMPDEFQVLFVRDAIQMHTEIQTTKEFIAWAAGPGAKLLA